MGELKNTAKRRKRRGALASRSAPAEAAGTFDAGVIDAPARQFERHVAVLARWFKLVGIDALRAYFREGRPLPPNPAMITFDDGYIECHEVALPLFARYGTKAAFFVSTGHVAKRRVFWWDKLNDFVPRSVCRRLVLDYAETVDYELGGERMSVVRALLSVVKVRGNLDIDRCVEGVARADGVPWRASRERGKLDVSDSVIVRSFQGSIARDLSAVGALDLGRLCARGRPVAALYTLVWGDMTRCTSTRARALDDLPVCGGAVGGSFTRRSVGACEGTTRDPARPPEA